jgi:hypothetical protein
MTENDWDDWEQWEQWEQNGNNISIIPKGRKEEAAAGRA